MTEDVDSPPLHTQIHPANSGNLAEAPNSYFRELKDTRDHDLDQEEKARRIAHDDLGIKKKQVRRQLS